MPSVVHTLMPSVVHTLMPSVVYTLMPSVVYTLMPSVVHTLGWLFPPSPGEEYYLGFLVSFSESNLLCAFVFQFIHFILFRFNLPCFI